MMWLTKTPIRLVWACAAMLPALQADESILAVQRLAVGSGHLERATSERILNGWERTAARTPEPARRSRLAPMTARGLTHHIADVLGVELPTT
jgi:hypothetical protein